jgi:uncharacterized protein
MSTEHPPTESDTASLDDIAANTVDALEKAVAVINERHPETFPWEFYEGALAAMLCMRRVIDANEWVPMLFDCDPDELFASPDEYTHFLTLWMERESQLRASLEAPVESFDDERAFSPAIVDWRGMVARLPETESARLDEEEGPIPSLGQMWADGFLLVVECWPDDWAPPRDKEIAAAMDEALDCIGELTYDDTDPPKHNFLQFEDGPPSVSQARAEAYGMALSAVYDLYDIARSLGPRTVPAHREAKIGRNDPCPCGSGKKYKKCCGR